MKITSETFVIVTVLLILTSCSRPPELIEVDGNKTGGLYETIESGKEYKFYNSDASFKLDTLTFIPFSYIDSMSRKETELEGIYDLRFKFKDAGILKFKEMTERNIGKQLCFVIGIKVMAAPIVQEAIPNGSVSVSSHDKKVVDEIVQYLRK